MADSAIRRTPRQSVRTAVVWRYLNEALDEQTAATGRSSLDVVDAGGGTGGFAVPVATLGHRVTVVDPSPDALAALERRAAESGVTGRIRPVQGDASEILGLVPPHGTDVVLYHGVLEVLDDPGEALAVAARVLRSGGLASILAANRYSTVLARALAGHFAEAQHALEDPSGRWGGADPVPHRFAVDDLEQLVRAAGFTITSAHGVRVFSDLVSETFTDEPGGLEALLDLEFAAAGHRVFQTIATQTHILARLA